MSRNFFTKSNLLVQNSYSGHFMGLILLDCILTTIDQSKFLPKDTELFISIKELSRLVGQTPRTIIKKVRQLEPVYLDVNTVISELNNAVIPYYKEVTYIKEQAAVKVVLADELLPHISGFDYENCNSIG